MSQKLPTCPGNHQTSPRLQICSFTINGIDRHGFTTSNMNKCESKSGNPEDDRILLHPFDYIRSLPGKGVRSKLAVAFNYWLNVDPQTLEKVCDIMEMLHNASLL